MDNTWTITKLTHWGWVPYICISKLTIICSDNGLVPGQCQAIIWTNAGKLLIGSLGTNFSEILIEIQTFSFKKKHLNMLSVKCQPLCLCLDELMREEAGNPLFAAFITYPYMTDVWHKNIPLRIYPYPQPHIYMYIRVTWWGYIKIYVQQVVIWDMDK